MICTSLPTRERLCFWKVSATRGPCDIFIVSKKNCVPPFLTKYSIPYNWLKYKIKDELCEKKREEFHLDRFALCTYTRPLPPPHSSSIGTNTLLPPFSFFEPLFRMGLAGLGLLAIINQFFWGEGGPGSQSTIFVDTQQQQILSTKQ